MSNFIPSSVVRMFVSLMEFIFTGFNSTGKSLSPIYIYMKMMIQMMSSRHPSKPLLQKVIIPITPMIKLWLGMTQLLLQTWLKTDFLLQLYNCKRWYYWHLLTKLLKPLLSSLLSTHTYKIAETTAYITIIIYQHIPIKLLKTYCG